MSDATQPAAEVPEAQPAEPTIEEIAAKLFVPDAEPAPAAEPEKAPEVPAEPPKDPAAERVAARIEAARKADLRAAKARQEIASQRAEIDKERATLAEERKVAEQLKAAKLSPSKALELLGMTPKQFLESLATEHEPASIATRISAEAHAEIAKLKEELQKEREERTQRELAARRQEADSGYNAATQQFLEHVDTLPEKYPHLIAEYTPAELASQARAAAEQHAEPYFRQFGVYPDDDVIAEHLEAQAKARAEALAERRARIGQKAPVPSEGKPTGDLRATQPEKGPSPRTMTSRAASEKATAQKPWSQEWADEESLRILSAALKAG